MEALSYVLVLVLASAVSASPLTDNDVSLQTEGRHTVHRRFINPLFGAGGTPNDLLKIRTKRSEEECEKLQLCRMHARANTNFFAAFQLYFVNKENAKPRTSAECYQRYSGCYQE